MEEFIANLKRYEGLSCTCGKGQKNAILSFGYCCQGFVYGYFFLIP
jgi:hypothetical protein